MEERPLVDREALADTGLLVSCVAIGRGMAAGESLDAENLAFRRAAIERVKRHLTDAAQLGATHAYLVPGMDGSPLALTRFADACGLLADYAGQRMIRLCMEAVPTRALSTARDTLAWLEQVRHPNLALLLDVGHCLISREDPTEIITRAGPLLGYMHFDDNDGSGDLHWALLTGKLTKETLRRAFDALRGISYNGALCLELNPLNPDPVAALRAGKSLLEELLAQG
jgi:sugar phosphate isomerase/epimerase